MKKLTKNEKPHLLSEDATNASIAIQREKDKENSERSFLSSFDEDASEASRTQRSNTRSSQCKTVASENENTLQLGKSQDRVEEVLVGHSASKGKKPRQNSDEPVGIGNAVTAIICPVLEKAEKVFLNCDDARKELIRCLEEEQDKDIINSLYEKTNQLCSLNESLPDYISRLFDTKQKEILESPHPTLKDLRGLETLQRNVKVFKPSHKMKDVADPCCRKHGKHFLDAFSRLESDPLRADASSLATKAQSGFPIAKMFCESQLKGSLFTMTFKNTILVNYLSNRIKALLDKSCPKSMKYIHILKYLRPNVPLAFQGCTTFEQGNVSASEEQNVSEILTKWPISIQDALKFDDERLQIVLTANIESHSDLSEDATLSLNLKVLKLAQLCTEKYAGNNLLNNWAESGFPLRNSKEFDAFIQSAIYESDLQNVINEVRDYHKHKRELDRVIGAGERATYETVEYALSNLFTLRLQR